MTGSQVIAFNADQGVSPDRQDSMVAWLYFKIDARDELCRNYVINRNVITI
jgi:hypothetical protein